MSVEGVSKSSIARILGVCWNTTARWEERAAAAAQAFNKIMTKGYELSEVQGDEIRTFSGGKKTPTWVFASMAVSSRVWASTVVGRRSYRNTRRLLSNTIRAGEFAGKVFVATDGFEFYGRVVRELLPGVGVHGQVIKDW